MFNQLKKFFSKNTAGKPFSQEDYDSYYKLKLKGIEAVLGKTHDLVGHALIPFAIGGNVDMYYFLNHIKGTGFATMELLEPDGYGPLPNREGTYELVAFTKHSFEKDKNKDSSFNRIERQICSIFTQIGSYSRDAILNPDDTCELANGEGKETTCIVMYLYKPDNKDFIIAEKKHHLLLCMQIFRKEMEYARRNGSEELLEKLKNAGYFPYSDLDRNPVVK